jgi:hypothetical protein
MEADPTVWRLTDTNLGLLGRPTAASRVPLSVRHGDWLSYFDDPLPADTTIYVISPPWAGGFSFATGLDITRTEPPIPLIMDVIALRDRSTRCYAVVQHTPAEPVLNMTAVTDRYPVLGSGRGCFVVWIR